jgi:ribosome recycling factor
MFMFTEELKNTQKKMTQAIARFKDELALLRIGRAQSAFIEELKVECYGNKMLLKEIASITIPDPKLIVIEPWDKSLIKNIEKAILAANLGLTPGNDGERIRIVLPPMTAERRQELAKKIGLLAEDTRIVLRNLRKEFLERVHKAEKEGTISKDNSFRIQKEIDSLMEKFNAEIEELAKNKEKELLTL